MGLNKLLLKQLLKLPALVYLLVLVALPTQANNYPNVVLTTDFGDIVLELYPEKAPVTVKNFIEYVNSYHYDGVIFHRVVKGFVIQTGGYGFDLYPREPGDPIINESNNGLRNKTGSIAMARTAHPDSARAQFFINLKNNKNLDPTAKKAGYTVFGRVIDGMDIVREISQKAVKRAGVHKHLPRKPIMILKARVVEPTTPQPAYSPIIQPTK